MTLVVPLTMTNIWDISHRQRGHLLHSSLSLRNQRVPVKYKQLFDCGTFTTTKSAYDLAMALISIPLKQVYLSIRLRRADMVGVCFCSYV